MILQTDYNGKIFTSEELIFKSSNRAFKFGDAIFETILVKADSIPLINYHLNRLESGGKALEFQLPDYWNVEFFSTKILNLVKINQLPEARVRLTVFRGEGPFGQTQNLAEYFLECFPLEVYPKTGISLGLYALITKSPGLISAYKTSGYLLNVMAKIYAQNNQLDDCLYLNDAGRICESSISNLFWIEEEKIYTPPLSEGPVAGVMRRHLMHTLEASGNAVIENELHIERLQKAEEIFLTNAVRGIIPVSNFNGQAYNMNITKELINVPGLLL